MKKLEGNKLVAVLLSAGMVTALLAACSIDTDKFGQGISDLGNAFNTSPSVEQTVIETSESETEDTQIPTVTETEETVETKPTATPTPTNSPTPLPERVDFSEYTDDVITDDFTVTTETFEESTHSDDDQFVFATFNGDRMVVTKASSDNIRDSINLVVDGFYSEAEGAYKRMAAKAKAEYNLSGVVEEPYAVNVDFEYSTYGRSLSVLMTYTVTLADEVEAKVIDFASFDMKSGQYVTLTSVTKDVEGLEKAFRNELENSLKHIIPAGTIDPDTGIASTSDKIADTPKADEFEVIYAAPTAAQTEGRHFVMIYGVVDGEIYNAVIEIDSYADYFNRYGASLFLG